MFCVRFAGCTLISEHQGNYEGRSQCLILKSSTLVKCHFGCQKVFFYNFVLNFCVHFMCTNMCYPKLLPSQQRPLSKDYMSQNIVSTICK